MIPRRFDSTEIRWFRSGGPDFDVDRLFAGEPGSPGPVRDGRSDAYVVSADDALGVKLRDDEDSPKLEIKSRISRRACDIGEGAGGFLESWVKWSWPGTRMPAEATAGNAPWVVVEKVRRQWRFEWRKGGVVVVDGERFVETGGALEVTTLSVREREFWTYGVEAFGTGEEAEGMVEAAARRLLAAMGEKGAREADSYGYPCWLRTRTG